GGDEREGTRIFQARRYGFGAAGLCRCGSGSGSQAAAAASVYGPGSPSWDAYYTNPLDTATWRPFCSGAGGTTVKFVLGVPVPACGPTGTTQIDVPLTYPYAANEEASTPGFQCVELVQRYLRRRL